MKKQQLETLRYPLGKESTTVGGVLKKLRLSRGSALRRDIRSGVVTVNGQPVQSAWQRISPPQVLGWYEYRIELYRDEEEKRRRLATELLRSGGFRGASSFTTRPGGGGMVGPGGR